MIQKDCGFAPGMTCWSKDRSIASTTRFFTSTPSFTTSAPDFGIATPAGGNYCSVEWL